MDTVTFDYIRKNKNLKNKKLQKYISSVNVEISGYRLTAMKNPGFIRMYCNKQANFLEKELENALRQY